MVVVQGFFELSVQCDLSRCFSEVFELATYKKINPTGRVVLAPIFLETMVVILYGSIFCSSAAYFFVLAVPVGSATRALASIAGNFPFFITVHGLREKFRQKHQLFLAFENFDLDSVQCFSDADRDFIHSAIAELYGSNEAFTRYVRGPLRQELLDPITRSPGLRKYGLLIISPGLALCGDAVVALWKGGAPLDVLLLYAVAPMIVGQLFVMPSALSLLELLCDKLAEPVLPRLPFIASRPQAFRFDQTTEPRDLCRRSWCLLSSTCTWGLD